MRRSVRNRLSLLLSAIVVLAFAAWQWRQESREAPGTLLALEPSAISHVEVHIGNAPTEHYAKRDGHWYRIDGAAVRADDGRLGELTETAAAAVLRWRPASDFDPARIGLTPSSATLALDGHTLDFGRDLRHRPAVLRARGRARGASIGSLYAASIARPGEQATLASPCAAQSAPHLSCIDSRSPTHGHARQTQAGSKQKNGG